ncbi:MAG: hypothetical protein IJ614_04750 [Prevotella sp.]|nr:hypothetical protein [Prevotella sp.]
MRNMMLWGLLSLLPMQLSAQVNPKKGYVITNTNDTIYGTVDYLTDKENAESCLFRKSGEQDFKRLLPSDIGGYCLDGEGVCYVSRELKTGSVTQRQFAEYLLKGGVSLFRYYYDGDNYYGFVDTNGKEVVMRDDKLNEDLSRYTEKLEARREMLQQVAAVMGKDPTVAERMWKMDLTSRNLTRLVQRYDEKYCTSDGECVVFKYDNQKSKSVKPAFYVGVAMNYAWFNSKAAAWDASIESRAVKYSGIAPTFMVGADITFPRSIRHLMSQVELALTPYSLKATEQSASGDTRMKCTELALNMGIGYLFAPESKVKPFLVGGLSVRHQMSVSEKNRATDYYDNILHVISYAKDLDYKAASYLGLYVGGGLNVGHLRLSATYSLPFGSGDGPTIKGSLLVGAAYRF